MFWGHALGSRQSLRANVHRERPKGTVVTQYHTQGGRADAGTQTGGAENAVLPELGGGGHGEGYRGGN